MRNSAVGRALALHTALVWSSKPHMVPWALGALIHEWRARSKPWALPAVAPKTKSSQIWTRIHKIYWGKWHNSPDYKLQCGLIDTAKIGKEIISKQSYIKLKRFYVVKETPAKKMTPKSIEYSVWSQCIKIPMLYKKSQNLRAK